MALKSWLASLKDHVSNVLGVQAPIHAGLGRYATETSDVSGVSRSGGMVASDTADTVRETQTYQAQPAWALACTGDTADTCKKKCRHSNHRSGGYSHSVRTKATIQTARAVVDRHGSIKGEDVPRAPLQLPPVHCGRPLQSVRQALRCGAGAVE